MFLTPLYWNFLSTWSSHHRIKIFWVHVHNFIAFSLWSTGSSLHYIVPLFTEIHFHQFNVLKLLEYMHLILLYWRILNTCTSLHCMEASLVHVPHFHLLKFLACNFLTSLNWNLLRTCSLLHCVESLHVPSLYWSFFSTCTSLPFIEFSCVHVLQFIVLKLLKYMFSLHCIHASWVHILHFNVLKLFEYMYLTSMYWSFLSTCFPLHCIDSSWAHVPHFIVLKHLEYMYLTSLYWRLFSICSSLHCWISTCTFSVSKLLEYMYLN